MQPQDMESHEQDYQVDANASPGSVRVVRTTGLAWSRSDLRIAVLLFSCALFSFAIWIGWSLFGLEQTLNAIVVMVGLLCTSWAIYRLYRAGRQTRDRIVLSISLYVAASLLALELIFVALRAFRLV